MAFATFSMRYFSKNLNLDTVYNDRYLAYSMCLILIKEKHFSSRKVGGAKAPPPPSTLTLCYRYKNVTKQRDEKRIPVVKALNDSSVLVSLQADRANTFIVYFFSLLFF